MEKIPETADISVPCRGQTCPDREGREFQDSWGGVVVCRFLECPIFGPGLSPLKQAFSLRLGAKIGRPNFPDPTRPSRTQSPCIRTIVSPCDPQPPTRKRKKKMIQDCKNAALKLPKLSLSWGYFGQFKGYIPEGQRHTN